MEILRDALAHGRVSASEPNDDLCLLKFDRPVKGRTRVVFSAKLTEEWLKRQIDQVRANAVKATTAAGPAIVSGL